MKLNEYAKPVKIEFNGNTYYDYDGVPVKPDYHYSIQYNLKRKAELKRIEDEDFERRRKEYLSKLNKKRGK